VVLRGQVALFLNILLTDALWRVSASDNQPAFHAAVAPHNAFFCLLMLILGIASGIFVGQPPRFRCTSERLSDNGFVGLCAAAVISLLGAVAACCQLVGWVIVFGVCPQPSTVSATVLIHLDDSHAYTILNDRRGAL
jgi:hypothetical protein